MSVKHISWVWEHSQAEGGTLLVALALADSVNALGGNNECWPHQETLARMVRLSPRQVVRCVAELEDLGEIEKQRTNNGNRYRFTAFGPEVTKCPNDADVTSTGHPRHLGRVTPTSLPYVEPEVVEPEKNQKEGLDLVAELWAYYQRVIPEARGWSLNKTRRQVIQRSLKAVGAKKLRVSVEAPADDPSVAAFNQCCRAVDGLAVSPWHNGENPDRRKWLEIRYALKGNSTKGQSDDEKISSMAALAPSAGLHLPPGVSQEKVDRRVEEIRVWHRSGGTFEPGRAAQAREELQAWGFEVGLLDGPPYVKLLQRGRRV